MERFTKKICGRAHGKIGRTMELAKKNKNYCRGVGEFTGCIEYLCFLEDQIEKGDLIQRIFKYDISQEVFFIYYDMKIPQSPVGIKKGKITARLQDGNIKIYKIENPEFKDNCLVVLYENDLFENQEQAELYLMSLKS